MEVQGTVKKLLIFYKKFLRLRQSGAHGTCHACHTLDSPLMVFKSDGKRNKKIDTRIGKANAVLRELYRSVVTKRKLSKQS